MVQFGGYEEQTGGGGAKGDTGHQGVKGDTGKQGIQGEQGKQGIKGDDGARGQKGDDGAQGQKGLDGKKGQNGAKGQDGANGQDGHAGIAGIDGTNGHDGKDGAKGASGRAGDPGAEGAQGARGAEGRAGADGVATKPSLDNYILIDTVSKVQLDSKANTEEANPSLNNIANNSIAGASYTPATGTFTFGAGIYEYHLQPTFYDTKFTYVKIINLQNTAADNALHTTMADFHGITKLSTYSDAKTRAPILLKGKFQVKSGNTFSFKVVYNASTVRANGLWDKNSKETVSYYLITQLGTGGAVKGEKGDTGAAGKDVALTPGSVTYPILAKGIIRQDNLDDNLEKKLGLNLSLKGQVEVFVAAYAGNQVWQTLQNDTDVMRANNPISHSVNPGGDLITLQFKQPGDLHGGVYFLRLKLVADSDISITVLNENSDGDEVEGGYYYKYTDKNKTNYSNSQSNKPIISRCVGGDCRVDINIINNGKDVLFRSESVNTKIGSTGAEYKLKYCNLSFHQNTAGKVGVENVIKDHLKMNFATYRNRVSGIKPGSFLRFIRKISS